MKSINRTFWGALAVAGILWACDSNSQQVETTDLGTEVNFHKRGNGEGFVEGELLRMNLKFTTASGQVITETREDDPMYIPYRTDTAGIMGQFQSVLELLSVGDSCTFEIPAEDVFQKTFQRPLPDSIEASSMTKWELGIAEQVSMEEYQERAQALQVQMEAEQLVIDANKIEAYLSENGLSAETTESGLRYTITQTGSGPTPDQGQRVNVRYAGRFMENGQEFDAGDYAFPLGAGQVIRGWDEGISYLQVGSKAVLYIPSALAYGPRGRASIPPNSILIFDVELLEIN
ncbi:MAG: FKBP-type peptidyl-prolyl cis-trans isomerase [Bacteroidota bacterium]